MGTQGNMWFPGIIILLSVRCFYIVYLSISVWRRLSIICIYGVLKR